MVRLDGYDVSSIPERDLEQKAVTTQAYGFYIRHPPRPHTLFEELTKEEDLFQIIHMGAVEVDIEKWLLIVGGLVERPFALTFEQLLKLPSTTVQSTHECFGSPFAPVTTALWRKDLPLDKARREEVLVAYNMNGTPLGRELGGPVRLVVPGWFGTNSTKWLSKIATGPYTTQFYNVKDRDDPQHRWKPVWEIDVNSMIVYPRPDTVLNNSKVDVEGWAWSHDGVVKVKIKASNSDGWREANLGPRIGFRWQKFTLQLVLEFGACVLTAKTTSIGGESQALEERRNHVHQVNIRVQG